MKDKKILFVVDGNNKIGLGHVYRAINLFDSLKSFRFQIFFLTNEIISKNIIKNRTNSTIIHFNDIQQNKKAIQKLKPDIVIIDKLKMNSNFLKYLKKNSKVMIGLDYVGDNRHLLDFNFAILYPYSAKSKHTIYNLDNTVIHKNFINNKYKVKKRVKSILIIQGGADTHCFLPKIIDSLNYVNQNFNVTVVVGSAFKCWNKLKKSINRNKNNIKILDNVKNMSSVMSMHDLAITGGGMTLLELVCIGVPSIVICGEKFENETANIFQKSGFGINLGFGKNINSQKIAKNISALINDYTLRCKMNKTGKNLIDGKGSNRIASFIHKIDTDKISSQNFIRYMNK